MRSTMTYHFGTKGIKCLNYKSWCGRRHLLSSRPFLFDQPRKMTMINTPRGIHASSMDVSSTPLFGRRLWCMPGALTRSFLIDKELCTALRVRHISVYTATETMSPPITPDNILQFPGPNIDIPCDLPVHQMIFDACDKYREKHAVEDFLTGRKYTYSELKSAIVRVASCLYKKGYRKGDVLLVFALNSIDYLVLLVACAAAGISFTTADASFTSEQLARQINDTKAEGLCVSAPLAETARDAVKYTVFPDQIKDFMVFGQAEGFQPFQQLLEDDGKAFPDINCSPQTDVCVLPYTAGTTGLPKGVMLSHTNCVANALQISNVFKPQCDDNIIGVLPLHHIYGMAAMQFTALLGGSSIFFLPHFEPVNFLKCLQDCNISVAHLAPPHIKFMVKHPEVSHYDLSSLKAVMSAGAPLGEDLTLEFREKFSDVNYLVQGYGLTEMSPGCNVDITQTPGAVGHMLPNTSGKVIDTITGETLGVGQLGEFCVKGPQVMLGYFNNQQATDVMIAPDGWLHTSDIASFNEDGVVTIHDRLKELIKYKGSQVAPAELEALLLSHPDVQDVAVIGVPD